MRNFTSYVEYETQDGDTWDQLALDMYGEEYMSDAIREANPDCAGIIVFGAGTVLRLPVFDEEPEEEDEGLPPWRTEA